MAPKQRAVTGDVDGVPYRHNLASGIIVVGSGLVSNDKRDTFKLKAEGTIEAQLRARPKFKELAAAAAFCGGGNEAEATPAPAAAEQPKVNGAAANGAAANSAAANGAAANGAAASSAAANSAAANGAQQAAQAGGG